MSVFVSSQTAGPLEIARPMASNDAAGSDRPICVHHKGDITVVVYSAPNQEPKRLNQAILPALHILLVEEGNEIAGLASILADYLSAATPSIGPTLSPTVCADTPLTKSS